MSFRYKVTSLLPLLILILVTASLSFALAFISSLSERIDRMIAIMGSGSVYALSDPADFIKEGEVAAVRNGNALMYTEHGEAALAVKGVETSYFSGMRGDEVDVVMLEEDVLNPVILSSSLSSSLSLAIGDRFTLLVWDEENGRTRPYLCTVGGIFSSVYPQLDSHLAYVPFQMLTSPVGYEILLPAGADSETVSDVLWENGILSETYRTMYSSLYQNVQSSVGILYIIIVAVALLASFFSSDAAQVYIARDRDDIKELWMLGMERREIRRIYLRITMSAVLIASAAGCIIGLLLAYLSPSILSVIAHYEPALLEYYVTSFSVSIPFLSIAVMLILSIFVSFLSVSFALRRGKGSRLF